MANTTIKLRDNLCNVMDATTHSDSIGAYIYAVPGYHSDSSLGIYPINIKFVKRIDIDYEDSLYDVYSYEQWSGEKDNILFKREDSEKYWLFLEKEDVLTSFDSLEEVKEYLYQLSIQLLWEKVNTLSSSPSSKESNKHIALNERCVDLL